MAASIQHSPGASLVVTTGANAFHFSNVTMLIASWKVHHPEAPLVVCDYGLRSDQLEFLRTIPGLHCIAGPEPNYGHPWEGKADLITYLKKFEHPWEIVVWIDADALFLHPLPNLAEVLTGYDVIIDAHVQSVGEIMAEGNRNVLQLRPDDAYFSSGFWVARRGCLLESYPRYTRMVLGQGNLWENDGFVASIYHEKLKLRTICGGVWHSRGKTSLHTCEAVGLSAYHAGQPIYVLHANDGYSVRADGRRIINRPELAAIQDHYERLFWEQTGIAAAPTGPW
jgi:hypothetical protein